MRRLLIRHLLDIIYLLAIALSLPWIAWRMIFHGKYREGHAHKLFGRVPNRAGERPCVWLHAVSVGEVNVLRTLVERLERQRPGVQLCISSTTKTGHDLARQRFDRHTVFYCPLDFTWAVDRAVARIRPDLLILAELELWPNLIFAAKSRGCKVAVINGRLSDRSFRGYWRLRRLIAPVLQKVDLIAAQDPATAERFSHLAKGVRNLLGDGAGRPASPEKENRFPRPYVHVTGSMKYDGAETDRCNPATERLRKLADFTHDDIVFLAGSTGAPEEELVLQAYRALRDECPRLRLVIVPRHPQRFDEVAGLLAKSGVPWIRRSQLAGSVADPSCAAEKGSRPVLFVDTVGELGAWWGTADIAFVGGSFGSRGGQNMIEPAAYGAAVCFGPNTRNFRDIVAAMLQADAACVVADGHELTTFARRCVNDRRWAAQLGQRARRLVLSHMGATDRTIDLLRPLLPTSVAPEDASLPAA